MAIVVWTHLLLQQSLLCSPCVIIGMRHISFGNVLKSHRTNENICHSQTPEKPLDCEWFSVFACWPIILATDFFWVSTHKQVVNYGVSNYWFQIDPLFTGIDAKPDNRKLFLTTHQLLSFKLVSVVISNRN